MPKMDPRAIRLPGRRRRRVRTYLWREWCFLRAAVHNFRINLALLLILLLVGGVLFRVLEPEKRHPFGRGVYYTWALIFGQPPEEYPSSAILQAMFFLVPLLGLLVIVEGLVEFALTLRDRKRNERSWCKTMATALSNHIILVGLGKLGFRTFMLLRQLGEEVAVIERNAGNQFLEEIRRDGSALFVGDARRETFLEEAHAARAKSIILATNDDLANLEVALDARRLNPQIRVVLRMFDQNMADKIRQGFNIQSAMSQSALSAPAFVTAALEGSIESSLLVGEQLLVMQRWQVRPDGPLCGKSVSDVMTTFGVGVLERRPKDSHPQLLPPPNAQLTAGDELLVQGTFETLSALAAREPALVAAT